MFKFTNEKKKETSFKDSIRNLFQKFLCIFFQDFLLGFLKEIFRGFLDHLLQEITQKLFQGIFPRENYCQVYFLDYSSGTMKSHPLAQLYSVLNKSSEKKMCSMSNITSRTSKISQFCQRRMQPGTVKISFYSRIRDTLID